MDQAQPHSEINQHSDKIVRDQSVQHFATRNMAIKAGSGGITISPKLTRIKNMLWL